MNVKGQKYQIGLAILIFAISIYYATSIPLYIALGTHINIFDISLDLIFSALFLFNKLLKRRVKYDPLPNQKNESFINDHTQSIIESISIIPFTAIGYLISLAGLGLSINLFSILGLIKALNFLPLYRRYTSDSILKWPFFFAIPVTIVHIIACGWILLMPPLIHADFVSMYIDAIYWATSRLLALGYGDLNLISNEGKLYNMIVMITGVGIYGIIIGNVTQTLFLADRRKERTREKFHDLNLFMHHYDIPNHLQHEILSYYKNLFTQRITENDQQIISELPTALQHELHLYMSIKLIGEIPLFLNANSQLKREVARSLQQQSYAPGDLIFSSVDNNLHMYIIGHGSVDLIHENGGHLATLKQGQSFGEAALIDDRPRTVTARARGYCDLYRLSREAFNEISTNQPELRSILSKFTQRRASDTK